MGTLSATVSTIGHKVDTLADILEPYVALVEAAPQLGDVHLGKRVAAVEKRLGSEE